MKIANVCKYTAAWGPLLSMKNESDSTQIHHTHTKKEWKNKIMPRAKKKKAECVFCNIILYAVMPRACTKDRRVWDGQGLLTEF